MDSDNTRDAKTGWIRRLTGRRSTPGAVEEALATIDPLELIRVLERSDRFRRDTALGGIFHHGKISFRELTPADSLHVIIDGAEVRAHFDKVSPLNHDPVRSAHYSGIGILAHNLSGMAGDVARLFGWRGHHHCEVEGELVRVDEKLMKHLAAGREEEARAPGPEAGDVGLPVPDRIPFGLVDEAVHLLDSEAAPWSIQLEARVKGGLDESRLRTALIHAIAAHPMARVRKAASRRSMHHDDWEIPPDVDIDPLRVVDCPDDAALARARAELQSRPVPLAESPPLRVRLARHPEGDVVMLNVNHAAMDGFGAMRVLHSVARAYAGEPDPPPKLSFLEARELPVRLMDADVSTRVRRQLALAEKVRDLVVPPARLARDGGSGATGYGFHHVALSPSETGALARLEHAGTMNDVLLAALHLAIERWNTDHGERCGRVGVLVPANLRPATWRDDMVGNFSLPTRVSTNHRSRRSPQATLRALTAQTQRKKRAGMGTALIELLGQSPLFPIWVKQMTVLLLPLTGNRLVDTAMLSNLGQLDEPPSFGRDAGDTAEIWFSPPARMPLGLSIGAVTVGGRLHLAFRYRLRLFDTDGARRFADRFVAELTSFIVSG